MTPSEWNSLWTQSSNANNVMVKLDELLTSTHSISTQFAALEASLSNQDKSTREINNTSTSVLHNLAIIQSYLHNHTEQMKTQTEIISRCVDNITSYKNKVSSIVQINNVANCLSRDQVLEARAAEHSSTKCLDKAREVQDIYNHMLGALLGTNMTVESAFQQPTLETAASTAPVTTPVTSEQSTDEEEHLSLSLIHISEPTRPY